MECVFSKIFGGSEWLRASERFSVVLRESSEDFLHLKASFKSSRLDLLVGRWCN